MTKALEEHYKEVEQKEARMTALEGDIKENERILARLREDYKTAVIKDSDNIDELFHEIESIEKKLKADKHKLKTLQTVTEDHLKKHAIEVLNGYETDVVQKYQSQADKISEKIEQAKKEYISKIKGYRKEFNEINEEYHQTARQYGRILRDNGIEKGDINHQLYKKIDDTNYGVITFLKVAQSEITQHNKNSINCWR